MESSYPLAVVLGPTASGKSELALDIAEHFGGEIVNFDSVQVYRWFNIGAAKVPVAQRRGIPHHGIDLVAPEELFTAGDFSRRMRPVLAEIRNRGVLPILAGGTGLYLRALLEGLFPGSPRDPQLRERLQARADARPPDYLHRLLRRLDPLSADRIHPRDIPKLIRAIEVCLLEGTSVSAAWQKGRDPLQGFEVTRIGLDPPRNALYERIDRRAAVMFERGLVEEVRGLLQQEISRDARAFGSLGYSQALDHLEGKPSLEQAVEMTARMTRRYAKRQLTWFRREPDVTWFAGFGDDHGVSSRVIDLLEARLRAYQGGE